MDPTQTPTSTDRLRQLANATLIVICVAALGGMVLVMAARGTHSAAPEQNPSATKPLAPDAQEESSPAYARFANDGRPGGSPRPLANDGSPGGLAYVPRPLTMDDSGGTLVWMEFFGPRVTDPLSLDHIRDRYVEAPD